MWPCLHGLYIVYVQFSLSCRDRDRISHHPCDFTVHWHAWRRSQAQKKKSVQSPVSMTLIWPIGWRFQDDTFFQCLSSSSSLSGSALYWGKRTTTTLHSAYAFRHNFTWWRAQFGLISIHLCDRLWTWDGRWALPESRDHSFESFEQRCIKSLEEIHRSTQAKKLHEYLGMHFGHRWLINRRLSPK